MVDSLGLDACSGQREASVLFLQREQASCFSLTLTRSSCVPSCERRCFWTNDLVCEFAGFKISNPRSQNVSPTCSSPRYEGTFHSVHSEYGFSSKPATTKHDRGEAEAKWLRRALDSASSSRLGFGAGPRLFHHR